MILENVKLTNFSQRTWLNVDKTNIQLLLDECNNKASKGQLIGELLDDDYIISSYTINLKNVSHSINNLNIHDDGIYGDVRILDTPRGRIISLLEEDFNKKFKFKIRASYKLPNINTELIHMELKFPIDEIYTWDIIFKTNLF